MISFNGERINLIGDPTYTGNLIKGQKTMAQSIPTVIASDQSSIPVSVSPAADNLLIQLLYKSSVSTAVNANEWQDALEYTVPTGYNFSPSNFQGSSSSSGDLIRVVRVTIMGYYNTATNTFTDGNSLTSPRFAAALFLHVDTAIGAGANDVITITYTNSIGTTGRTATATIPKSSPIGTRIEAVLQTGDYGVRDITNITHTATGQAGAFHVEGTTTLFHLTLSTGNVQYDAQGALNAFLIRENETVNLQYLSGATASRTRRISLMGPLIPIPT